MVQSSSKGENLIFIISQPRSGSTLLQTLLSQHTDIATTPEPWILLPLLSILRDDAHEADYNAQMATKAIRDFIKHLPQSDKTYYEGLSKLALHLYESVLARTEKRFFLDKTPRYYFIIAEIRKLFPNALIILLLRNPLAVLCSQITKMKKQWLMLGDLEADYVTALHNILWTTQQSWERVITIKYEELVHNPSLLTSIFDTLGLDLSQDLTSYQLPEALNTENSMGDKNILQFNQVQASKSADWKKQLSDPQVWRVTHDYLHLLGQQLIEALGYDFAELERIVDNYYPGFFNAQLTIPLSWFFKHTNRKLAKWHPRFLCFFLIRLLFFRVHQPYTFRGF